MWARAQPGARHTGRAASVCVCWKARARMLPAVAAAVAAAAAAAPAAATGCAQRCVQPRGCCCRAAAARQGQHTSGQQAKPHSALCGWVAVSCVLGWRLLSHWCTHACMRVLARGWGRQAGQERQLCGLACWPLASPCLPVLAALTPLRQRRFCCCCRSAARMGRRCCVRTPRACCTTAAAAATGCAQ